MLAWKKLLRYSVAGACLLVGGLAMGSEDAGLTRISSQGPVAPRGILQAGFDDLAEGELGDALADLIPEALPTANGAMYADHAAYYGPTAGGIEPAGWRRHGHHGGHHDGGCGDGCQGTCEMGHSYGMYDGAMGMYPRGHLRARTRAASVRTHARMADWTMDPHATPCSYDHGYGGHGGYGYGAPCAGGAGCPPQVHGFTGYLRSKFGFILPSGNGHGFAGGYHRVYSHDPAYFDRRDGEVWGAQGYGAPMAVPLAPVVGHTYNYSWGLPASRLTPVSRPYP